jgi:lipopolysaccharide transport system permease protein
MTNQSIDNMHRAEILIEAGRTEGNYWRDIWHYRELLYFLAWRDVLVRYKQTVIGIAWALLRPLLTVAAFTIVFNKVAGLDAPGSIPYPLLVYAAMLPWQFFSTGLSEAGTSLIGNANLISKVYFPRLIVPTSALVTSLVDLVIILGLLVLLMAGYGYFPDFRVLALPLFIGLAFGAAFGTGLWLAALNVKYRDFRYVLPFIVQVGVYISPIGFSTNNVPADWRLAYSLNPLVGIIDGFRWSLLRGESPLSWLSLSVSVAVTSFMCVVGIWHFRRTERTFADVI